MSEPSHQAKNAAAFREGLATVFAEILMVLEAQEDQLEAVSAYTAGESFTITGPPMIWDASAGNFVVDVETADDLGWRSEVPPHSNTVVWKKTMP